MARPKGAPNRLGAQVKENVIAVFNRLEGTAGMAKWAQENMTEFYRIYARLIPTESISEVTFRDATELSESELLAIALSCSPGAIKQEGSEEELSGIH